MTKVADEDPAGRHYQSLDQFHVPERFRGRNPVIVQLWWIVEATIFRCSPQFLFAWRRFLLRLFGARIGKNVLIRSSVSVTYPWNLEIGDHAWIGDEVVLYTLGHIKIGDNAVVSQRSYLCTGMHDIQREDFAMFASPITIGPEVWLATDVFVAPGVSVGRGAVVGARSTVLADLPGGMVCHGTPAVPTRPRMTATSDRADSRGRTARALDLVPRKETVN
jgi:putative colanic acid biosynthesis acetyltransferase WcaF